MSHRSESSIIRRSLLTSATVGALLLAAPALWAQAAADLSFHRATVVRAPLDTAVPQSSDLFALACATSASCSAGGSYKAGGGLVEAMVVSRSNGHWLRAVSLQLPMNAAAQPFAEVNGLACISAGNCVAVGDYQYQGGSGKPEAFIATQRRGRWSRAFVPALPANASPTASNQLEGVSCLRIGYCAAIGNYRDLAGNEQIVALAKPVAGHWGQGVEVTAPVQAGSAPRAFMEGISCTAPGACVAVGPYDSGTNELAMGAVELTGTWRRAVSLRLPPNANGTFAALRSISCTTAGSCLAVGAYSLGGDGAFRALGVTESKGHFGRAFEITAVPGGVGANPVSELNHVSCIRHGPCVAVGFVRNKARHFVAMYAIRSVGHWAAAFEKLPASAATGRSQDSELGSVSCSPTGTCTAVGFYAATGGGNRADAASTG